MCCVALLCVALNVELGWPSVFLLSCIITRYCVVYCGVGCNAWYSMVRCGAVRCGAVRCGAVLLFLDVNILFANFFNARGAEKKHLTGNLGPVQSRIKLI